MPRDVTILCRQPVETREVAEALLLHDETWGVRALDDGPMMQVCRDATHPVITVLGVRRVDSFDEVERVLAELVVAPARQDAQVLAHACG